MAGAFESEFAEGLPSALATLDLLESELSGHERGVFTGAVRQKPGRFEDAAKGTPFLDEIGDPPLLLQIKRLQVIEEKTFTRVGGNQPLTVDVRILAATNRDLEAMVRERQQEPGRALARIDAPQAILADGTPRSAQTR